MMTLSEELDVWADSPIMYGSRKALLKQAASRLREYEMRDNAKVAHFEMYGRRCGGQGERLFP